MAKYRKKPVVIEAFQLAVGTPFPSWFDRARNSGEIIIDETTGAADIYTLEGVMHASIGDWVIRGITGEIYPCKPNIFTATYEPADTEVLI